MTRYEYRPGNIPDPFNTEETPVAFALINSIGGVISKSAAKDRGRFEGNKALWDGTPSFRHPTHNRIYNPRGEMPDVAAQSLHDAGLIADPYADAMWAAIQRESNSARSQVEAMRAQSVEFQRQAAIARVAEKTEQLTRDEKDPY